MERRGKVRSAPPARAARPTGQLTTMQPKTLLAGATLIALLSTSCRSGAGGDEGGASAPPVLSEACEVPPGRPLVVYSDLRVRPGEYLRPAEQAGGEGVVVLLEGVSGVTLELEGVELRGAPPGTPPDRLVGIGLLIRGCEEIVVRGGSLAGYRVGVRVESSRDVRLEELVVEDVFAERLASTASGPDPGDRLEVGGEEDWALRHGGGIVLVDSSRVEVTRCRVERAQNGLVAVRCEGGVFEENDLSRLSGWGIALDRSQGCRIAGNLCEGVVRGYVPGRFAEDYGAAGILLGPGSSGNEVAGNRVWGCSVGGRERRASGTVGERNLWRGNLLEECAVACLDVTGSVGSWVVENRLSGGPECGARARGVRALVFEGNRFESILGPGLSVEGGADCIVAGNLFAACDRGLEFVSEPGAEGSGENRGHWAGENTFRENLQDLVLEHGEGLTFWRNAFEEEVGAVHLVGLTAAGAEGLGEGEVWGWLRDPRGNLPSGRVLDCRLAPPAPLESSVLRQVAAWKSIGSVPGVPEDAGEGAGLDLLPLGEYGPWSDDGDVRGPGGSIGGLLAGARWSASWFRWDRRSDPRGDLSQWRSLRFDPVERALVRAWSDPWGGSSSVRASVGEESFGLIAGAEFQVPVGGTYELRVLSDDGVRILVDEAPVLEDWTWHSPRQGSATVELEAGSHSIDLEYFQIDGSAVLSVELVRPSGSDAHRGR